MNKQLTMTGAMAAALAALPACSSNDEWNEEVTSAYDTAVCVDNQGRRVEDERCDDRRAYGSSYRYFYLRGGAPVPYYGDAVTGPRYAAYGSYSPRGGIHYDRAPASTRMTRSAAVSRGGLGASGRGFGGARG